MKYLGLFLLALVGCRAPDTVVVVYVQGQTPRPLVQLDVAATVGAATRMLRVPAVPAGTIFLPTSFSLQIPREETAGDFTVTVTALDGSGTSMGTGTAAISPLAPGEQSAATVSLGEVLDVDAGIGPEVGRAD